MNLLLRVKLSLSLALLLLLCWVWLDGMFQEKVEEGVFVEWPEYAGRHLLPSLPVVETFVCPINPPGGEGAYVFRAFGEENNTGEIWKLEPGSQEQETVVVAMGSGLVLMAEMWGSDFKGVVILLHRTADPERPLIESMVSGLDTLQVYAGQTIRQGEQLGLIRKAGENGLQWEVREALGLGIGPGVAEDRRGWLKPSDLLSKNGIGP